MADWYEITAAEMQQKINRYWQGDTWKAFLKIISYEIIELWRKYGLCYTDFAFYDWKHFDGMKI